MFTFENQGTNTFLVYKLNDDDQIDTLSLGMIKNNKIKGIIPILFTQMDDSKYLKYNVTSKVPVSQFFNGAVNKKRLLGVFSGICSGMLAAEEYMVDQNSLVLNLDYMFSDVSSCDTSLICLPINCEDNKNIDLGKFFKEIMFSTQFDQTEDCDYVAKIINYLNSTATLSLSEFRELLETLIHKNEKANAPKQSPVSTQQTEIKKQPIQPPQPVVQMPVKQREQPKVEKPEKKPQILTPPVNTIHQNTANPNEKKMSILDLLIHYNKENAEKYKAQKNAENSSNLQQPQKADTPKPTKKGQKAASANIQQPSFAIPGQESPKIQPVQQPTNQKAQPQAQPQVEKRVENASMQAQYIVPTQAANFGETTVLNAAKAGETTVLGATQNQAEPIKPYLIRSKNNTKIILDKPRFRIGKEKSYVDYFIGDNSAISRSHADIICNENGEFFVVDMNSTNHTYVNGTMLQSGTQVPITHGTKICLANEDFEFKMY